MSDNLIVDKIYEGTRKGNASDDPLFQLMGVGNQGGFRYLGNRNNQKIIVLTSSLRDPDWPDNLDQENGIFTYYGDNKSPGRELHNTPRYGNLLLRDMFNKSHGNSFDRSSICPIFVFASTGVWRDMRFLGLAAPGADNLDSNSDLVAVWRLKNGQRFQNYQAKFTILDTPTISFDWINDIKKGNILSENCPKEWIEWVDSRRYRPLKAARTIEYRSKEEQIPVSNSDIELIDIIHNYFSDSPVRFEACAAKLAAIMLPNIISVDITRPSKDGGRDAVGKYRIGTGDSAVLVDFALEAKCYGKENPVGVKEISRLISRLRHRQFGIIVTTSYVGLQAYQEIKEDQHPVVIISSVDIVKLLKLAGINTKEQLRKWLQSF